VVLVGGTYPAEAGHYRFRTERVYLPRRPVQMKKSSTNERVKWRMWNLRRYCAPPDHNVKAMCAAQYFSSNRQRSAMRRQFHDRGGRKELVPAAGLSTTLVLDPQAPDFSTDTGNSALIVTTKSRTAL
jgi:hypothetical protein